jgi:hypothetical protein
MPWAPRGFDDDLVERPSCGIERGGQVAGHDDRGAGAALAEFVDQGRNRCRRRADDRQVGRLRQRRDIGVGQHPGHGLALRIHRHDDAAETAGEQVAHQHVADPLRTRAGADHRNALRIEQALQEMETHGETVVPVGDRPPVPNTICYGIAPRPVRPVGGRPAP